MRRTVTKSIAIIGEGVSMRTRLYSSGKRQKLCDTTQVDDNKYCHPPIITFFDFENNLCKVISLHKTPFYLLNWLVIFINDFN